jgi:PAS domain S-box-containing protein
LEENRYSHTGEEEIRPLFTINCNGISWITATCIWLILTTASPGLTEGGTPFKPERPTRAGQDVMTLLTAKEKAWLTQHRTIRIAGPRAFPPFHYYEDKTLKGMAADYVNLVLSLAGVTPEIQSDLEWRQVLKGVKEHKIDLISCIAETRDRKDYLEFTIPYLSFPLVIVTQTNAPFMGGVDDLHGRKVAFIRGAAAYEWIRDDGIKITPYFVKTPLEGLMATSLGHAQAHIDNLATATYLIQKQGLTNLKISAPAFNENYNLYMAARKDWPELVSIINKAFTVITPEQHANIRNRFLSVQYDHGIRKQDLIKWVAGTGAIATMILAVILMWNRRLSREILERKRAEAALKKSENNYRSTLNALHIGIIVHSRDTRIELCNPEAERILGMTSREISGKKTSDPVWKFVHEDLSPMAIAEYPANKVFSTKTAVEKHIIGIIRPGRNLITWGMVHAAPLFSSTGQLEKAVVNFVDITDLKRAEKEKMDAQTIAEEHKKLALVGQIAGTMAHDFNNILGIIMGNAELALLGCRDVKTKDSLELIFQQTLRGKNLTKDLVAFAKDQEPKQEFFSIREKINLVLSLLKKDMEGMAIIREDKPGVPELLADPGMIEHALVNLIQNAIHATSMTTAPRIIIRTHCHGQNIILEIEDNGCGIQQKYFETIYAPSFTLKGNKDITGAYAPGIKGTGYGMANVKRYIQQHRGSISVESEPGSGTKFTICLPVIKKELTREEKTELKKTTQHSEKNILVVEDETAISGILYRLLTQTPFHHRVDIAGDGQAAIDLFEKNRYDLISLDHMLPGKINGMDVYNHVRARRRTIPILFISGNIEFLESIKTLTQKDPRIYHLSKPCQNSAYVNAINELFDRVTG